MMTMMNLMSQPSRLRERIASKSLVTKKVDRSSKKLRGLSSPRSKVNQKRIRSQVLPILSIRSRLQEVKLARYWSQTLTIRRRMILMTVMTVVRTVYPKSS